MAETLRVATFNTELARRGPGILLRDILKGSDPQIAAVMQTLVATDADIVALQGFDYDLEGAALNAFADALADSGLDYPHRFAAPPNAGAQTDVDLDGDGRLGGPGDAQGFGRFYGEGAMAILSRHPIATEDVRDFSGLLWRDLPGSLFDGAEAHPAQRLSSNGHWVVPIEVPGIGRVHVLTFHASPPVFDGPEDRNGKRNHDEVAFWSRYLDGAFGPAPTARFILMGDANLDPVRGDGRGEAMQALLADPALQDPLPDQPTAAWTQTGPMRVDYILPSADWTVTGAQVGSIDTDASRHAIVWVDLRR